MLYSTCLLPVKMKFDCYLRFDSRTKQLNFGDDLALDPDPGFR